MKNKMLWIGIFSILPMIIMFTNIPVLIGDDAKTFLLGNQVKGKVRGLKSGVTATVILANDSYLKTYPVEKNGSYHFKEVPNGQYYLKVDVEGYNTGRAKNIVVKLDKPSQRSKISFINFEAIPIDSNVFSYHWEEDGSRSGSQHTAYINQKQKVTFLGQPIVLSENSASEKLRHDYNIMLSNDGEEWNQEYAYRFLETIKSIPQKKRYFYGSQTLKASKWMLTKDHITDDIQIKFSEKGNQILISTSAFTYATPKLVLVDNLKGTFFSKKLHHALVRYITQNGRNLDAVEEILKVRFGSTTRIPDYKKLTAPTTKEDRNSFQQFHPNELLEIINMFEEMPKGYHVVKGLKYLVRRKNGMPHPLYPAVPAVAWPTAHQDSYIEFMETAFLSDIAHMHRLIIHEKAHFMWANLFSKQIREDWILLGEWYRNPKDPDGWSTRKQTEFVSGYAHRKNPNEDMAESLSYFVLNPDKLRSRSLPKYEFIKERIMHGSLYISKIREDLTFEVLNLFPDYNYPGKIKRVDITVEGAPNEDKKATVEIELNALNHVFSGAKHGYARVFSDIGTFTDFYMMPVNKTGSILRGSFPLSKRAKDGFWATEQIVITDQVGNQRFEGVDDFGWKMFVNNPLSDTVKPRYVPKTLALKVSNKTMEGRQVKILNVSYEVDENKEMRKNSPVYAQVTNPDSEAYRLEEYGTYDPVTKRGSIDLTITEYFSAGNYGVPFISMTDQALNEGSQHFSDSPDHQPLSSVYIRTTNADIRPPEVDLNRIRIKATPTNPQAPNGETIVEITYFAKDNKAGLGAVNYRLLDPQGISHFEYHYHENFRTLFFKGSPVEWKQYNIRVVLPVGSAPGTWGLQTMEVSDKANNRKSYNFVETMHFNVEAF